MIHSDSTIADSEMADSAVAHDVETLPENSSDDTYSGDTTVFKPLSVEARRALVGLLRHGVILASSKQQLFKALQKELPAIQAHLDNMFLTVLVDERAEVAVLLQQETEDNEEESVSLISRRTLTLYDTLLLLVLRKHFQERETAGEQRIFIDIDRIEARLTPFLPLTNSSKSDRRKLNSSLKNMKEKRLIQYVSGDNERFEITPVIRYVVNAEFLEQLFNEYTQLADNTAGVSEANDV
ncbi:MAG: DUF4194 domain-containing protein [Gammaproteobacteria bacterium]|nr:DUF4194 domain-containing protein [Gammaproteobacteria bacterium]MDH5803072.1 DUF4194 domain-containing protein [Gammaproteobacteria bacterium]